tara:strand:- start:285 stop:743 length:459 start_codon:yes stop_codon:yes gene_type:complete
MSESLIIPILCLIAGGAWQWWDGSDYAGVLPTLVRLAIAAVIAAVALNSTDLPLLISAICGVIAILSIHLGYTKWESYKVMLPRYGGPAAVVFLLTGSWIYLLLGLAAGALYPALYNINRGEEIARVFKGAAILGGLSLLSLWVVDPGNWGA